MNYVPVDHSRPLFPSPLPSPQGEGDLTLMFTTEHNWSNREHIS
jgi:hypothetical protein